MYVYLFIFLVFLLCVCCAHLGPAALPGRVAALVAALPVHPGEEVEEPGHEEHGDQQQRHHREDDQEALHQPREVQHQQGVPQ